MDLLAFVLAFVLVFVFAFVFAFVLIKLSNVQVNHHGKTITVGGKEDADTELLVERVRTKTKGGTNGGIEGGGTSATPQRHNCGNCQMAVVRTLDRGDILIPQVYLLSQVFSRENLGVDGGKVKVIAWQNHIWDRRESDDLETLIQSLNPPQPEVNISFQLLILNRSTDNDATNEKATLEDFFHFLTLCTHPFLAFLHIQNLENRTNNDFMTSLKYDLANT